MCAVGLRAGSSMSVPYGTRTYVPSRTVQYRSDPHSRQRAAWFASASPSTINEPAALVTVSLSRSISPQGKNAEPVSARQLEQWQLNAATNSSETS
jgi:hypothetical protein